MLRFTLNTARRFSLALLIVLGLSLFAGALAEPAEAATNLIPNPTLTTPDPGNPAFPSGWDSSNWGTNTASFKYQTSGGYNNQGMVRVDLSNYGSGTALWYFYHVNVIGGSAYTFSDYYRSNQPSFIEAEIITTSGSYTNVSVGSAAASDTWKQTNFSFIVPTNAKKITVYQYLTSNGYLETSNYSLTQASNAGFNRPLVSINFDDGASSVYNKGLTYLNKYGLKTTQYIITGSVGNGGYMNWNQIKAMYNQGHQIGSHSVTHRYLTQLSPTELNAELFNSKQTLENQLGAGTVRSFAAPYGDYNGQVVAAAKNYYQSFRTASDGFNTRVGFDPYQLNVWSVLNTTSLTTLQGWLNTAKKNNAWLILLYHEVGTSGTYSVSTSKFDQQLNAIKNSGIAVVTMDQALKELTPQVTTSTTTATTAPVAASATTTTSKPPLKSNKNK